MSTMTEKIHNSVFMVLCLLPNLQTCFGLYDCYQLSSGKDICFMLDLYLRTSQDSIRVCGRYGGSVLEIYNAEMQRVVERFVKSKTYYLEKAWLKLMRKHLSSVWEWGGVGSDRFLSYSNWDGVSPVSYEGSIDQAFMDSTFKWKNSYNPDNASTICIQGSSERYWLGSETTSIVEATTPVVSVSTADSATTKITTIKMAATTTTTTKLLKDKVSVSSADIATIAAESPKEIVSVSKEDSTGTRLPLIKTADSAEEITNSITSSNNISSAPETVTTTTLSQNLAKAFTVKTTTSNSDPAAGVGVGLVAFMLIIVSSFLSNSFVFVDEIPLHFKSSKNRKLPPRETGSDVNNNCYDHLGDRILGERSPYKEGDVPSPIITSKT